MPKKKTPRKTSAGGKKKRVSAWVGENRDPSVDSSFGAALSAAQTALGTDKVSVSSETETAFVGLPLPALSLRYLFQCNVFLLSRIVQIAGEEGSCKSQLLHEIARWHFLYGGGGGIASNENKDSPRMRHALLEWNPLWLSRCSVANTTAADEWQTWLVRSFQFWRPLMDKVDGPGRTIPLFFGIDSLTATDTQNQIDETMKRGFAQRGYSELAMVISRFMRQAIVSNMTHFPFTVIGTNHMKPATDHMGRAKKNVPGGKAVPFMATYLLETHKIKDIETSDYTGIRIGIKLDKNSGATSRRWIEAELLWWQDPSQLDPDTQRPRLQAVWDWHTASIEMILNFESRIQSKKTLFNNLLDITGLRLDRSKRTGSSDVLGVPASDPQSFRELGQVLEGRPELLQQIYPLLGIEQYYYFQPGLDYRQMLEEARAKGAQVAAKTLYNNRDNLPQLDPSTLTMEDLPAETTPVED